jgi:hypothetical protein
MMKRMYDEVNVFGEMERRIRDAIHLSWGLQEKEINGDRIQNVENQVQRIVARALQNFREDIQYLEK